MTIQYTEAGQEARDIKSWAWQDPERRAVAALEAVNEIAAAATDARELAQIRESGSMLSRLVDSLSDRTAPQDPVPPGLLSAQLAADADTLSVQLDLAAIHGRHIPGTQYTFRHGWIPLIGPQLVDKHPQWLIDQQARKAAREQARELEREKEHTGKELRKEDRREAEEVRTGPRFKPAPHPAAKRELTPEQQAMVEAHNQRVAQAARAVARAASPATPRAAAGARQPKITAVRAVSGQGRYVQPKSEPAAPVVPQPKPVIQGGVVVANAAAAKGQALTFQPGTVGAKLQKEDPALASLAAPGASMEALKSYIDARVAAEVARQMGQITRQQHEELQKAMAQSHRSTQKLISFVRKQAVEADEHDSKVDRTQLVMYNLFNAGAVAIALGGIALGVTPVVAALAAGIMPLVNIIHDYVRSSG